MSRLSTLAVRRASDFWGIRLVFLMEAVTLGAWLPRIPDFKTALQMDAGVLGLTLVGLPVGTLVGFLFAARVAQALGLRRACMAAGPAFAIVFIAPGFARSPFALFMALAACGFAVALIEVAMNTKAGRIEIASGRRIMSQCHGYWAIGTVVGAVLGGLFAQAAIPALGQFAGLNPLFALAAFASAWLIPDDPEPTAAISSVGFFTLPGPGLVVLCLMPVGIMALEGAIMDWSAVFVREILMGEPVEAAAAYGVFATMVAVTRLAGDRLAERFGAATIVLVSSLCAALGVAVFALAPNLPVALAGAALVGSGVATVYPLAVSAAAASPGKSAEANVAAVSFIAFSVFLVAPPVIGGLAELFDLRVALALLVPVALTSAALSRSVRVRSRRDR